MSQTKFLDKTLLAVARAGEQLFFSEAFARQRGLLQLLDIRIKLVTFLLILVLISLVHTPRALWVLYALSLVLAGLSRVPQGLFLKRVWLFVPLFSAAIVLPALLNIITPGEPVLTLVTLDHPHAWGPYVIPQEIAVTRQGLWGGIVFVSRVAASVSFAVLFTLTAKWADIFSGLRGLFIPRIFVVTLGMTERYLFVFLRMIQDMYRARKSRTLRPFSVAAERNWVASRIGVTFRKSMEMSADVYNAMLSRGFHGEFRAINRFRIAGIDYLWLATVVCFGGILLMWERGLLP
ncbi:MAG TPA: cobalt ECF transporter T component CbiQ [Nitrospirota bacterium]